MSYGFECKEAALVNCLLKCSYKQKNQSRNGPCLPSASEF